MTMAVVFYTVSFQATATVLTYASFTKQTLPDQAARDNLRDLLVGPKLPIGTDSPVKFEIPASFLAVDAIPDTPPTAFITNPTQFQVGLSAPGPVIPGDGVDKVLQNANSNSFQSVVGFVNATKQLTIQLQLSTDINIVAWIVYQNQPPILGHRDPAPANDKNIIFTFPTSFSSTPGDEFLFLMQGAPLARGTV